MIGALLCECLRCEVVRRSVGGRAKTKTPTARSARHTNITANSRLRSATTTSRSVQKRGIWNFRNLSQPVPCGGELETRFLASFFSLVRWIG